MSFFHDPYNMRVVAEADHARRLETARTHRLRRRLRHPR